MSDDDVAVVDEAATDVSDPPSAESQTKKAEDEKISLLEMILFLETEADDIDIWERVLRSEGEKLYTKMARRRAVLRRVIATLELVKMHESAFIDLVKSERRALAAAAEAKKRTSSQSSRRS